MMRRSVFILIAILATFSFASLRAPIVYVSRYRDLTITPLPLAKKDAMNMKKALSFAEEVVLVKNPTSGNLISEFKAWASSAKPGDTLLFYYAGHGKSDGEKFYFIPYDADPNTEQTWVSFDELRNQVPNGVNVVWLIDACYSGSIVKGRPLREIRIEEKTLKVRENEVIITSSSGNEISLEMPDKSGGIFTVALVEGLKGKADTNGDGWVESGELYAYVEKRVLEMSRGRQRPVMKGRGDLKIVKSFLKELLEEKLEERGVRQEAISIVTAIMNGERCTGEKYEGLKTILKDYLNASPDEEEVRFEILVAFLKLNWKEISCGGNVPSSEEEQEEEHEEIGSAEVHPARKGRESVHVIWQRTLGGSYNDVAMSLTGTSDSGLVVVGYTESQDGDVQDAKGSSDFWIVKLNSHRRILWKKTLGGSWFEIAYSVASFYDGGVVVAGYTESNDGDVRGNHGGRDFWVVRLDEDGRVLWSKTLGGSYDESAFSVAPLPEEGLVVAGYSESNDGDVGENHGGKDFWIVRLDEDGNFVWGRVLGGSGDDWANSLIVLDENTIVVAGTTWSSDGDVKRNHGNTDFWVVKLAQR